MFPMQITLSNISQLNAVMVALCLDIDTPEVHGAAEPSTAELIQMAQARKDAAAPAPKSAAKTVKTAPSEATAEVVAADAPEQSTEQQAPPKDTAQPAAASSAAEPLTYDVVGKAITDRAKTDRSGIVALLAKFGVKKGPELAPEQYADFMAELG